jgi:hypothetical protein
LITELDGNWAAYILLGLKGFIKMSEDEKLRTHVNSSGFPLQIGAAHTVQNTEGDHGWHVLSKEHAWKSELNVESGFIDLILEDRDREHLLVVECKRVQNSSWLFLHTAANTKRRQIKAWVSFKRNGNLEKLNWCEHPGDPSTVESEFCVVPGQDAKSKPMLERVASELVLATEAFALEDNGYYERKSDYLRISVPLLLTTAELKICTLSPDDISLATGEISKGHFETVPYVRFRKQLSTRTVASSMRAGNVDYNSLSRAKENTVFVVNSAYLVQFLKEFEIDERSSNEA